MLRALNILDMFDECGEVVTQDKLSTFYCPDPDIVRFVKHNAIDFALRKVAITYLIINDSLDVAGIFALTNKSIGIPSSILSSKERKRIAATAANSEGSDTFTVPAFLIAQLSKNFALPKGRIISGSDIMEFVVAKLVDIQREIGGHVMWLDCATDNEIAYSFYLEEGFKQFDTRSTADGHQYNMLMRVF